jgi:DNA-binding transcriptional regulator LsrR (DeoR family)
MALRKAKNIQRRPRRSLTDEERIKITLDRFSPLQGGKPATGMKELQDIYGRDPAVISKAIVEAFRRGLVEIKRADRPSLPERMESLEQKLLSRFNLRNAIVIRREKGSSEDDPQSGDALHAQLGQALASFIASGGAFRDGDTIGLGSGRGVFYTVDALDNLPPLRLTGIKLVSLTGALFPQDHAKKLNLRLDADIHVNLFGRHFAQPVEVHQLQAPLVPSDKNELSAVKRRTWLGGDRSYGFSIPSHSLIGVGVLSRGHKMFDAVTSTESASDQMLTPINQWLKPLVNIAKELSTSHYCPVADISNNLFYVEPPRGLRVSPGKEEQIKDLIQNVNANLLNIDDKQLRQVQTIVIVAAGLQKARAIRQLLDDESYHIRFLCTDETTVLEILS